MRMSGRRCSGWPRVASTLFALLVGCSHGSASPDLPPPAPLEGTRWWLVRVGETPVVADEPGRRANLVFDAGRGRVSGAGGCNQLSGGYEQSGDELRFGAIASTRMACPAMDVESAFFEALGRTARFEIRGRALELLDSASVRLARFEAGPAR